MVIPCCFYGLDGTKNLPLRVIDGQGKYKAYTDYVKNIASKAGFSCQEDYLRIPSTKNIAILGLEQKGTPQKEELETMVQLASTKFLPRKTDREKDEERRESKKLKLENS